MKHLLKQASLEEAAALDHCGSNDDYKRQQPEMDPSGHFGACRERKCQE